MAQLSSLAEYYITDKNLKLFLDYWLSRTNSFSGEKSVESILEMLNRNSIQMKRNDLIQVLKLLERFSLGKFTVGRRNKQSRFEWKESLPAIKQVLNKHISIEAISKDDAESPKSSRSLKHTFQLRQDYSVDVEFPVDLTKEEANRFSRFVETIPFLS